MRKVFVMDGEYKHTLAIVRSLGKAGYYVIVGSPYFWAQSFYSKYCNESVIYPETWRITEFLCFMIDFINKNNVDTIVPVGYKTNILCSKYKKEFEERTSINYDHLPEYNSMGIACDKSKSMEFAKSIGVKVPKKYERYGNIEEFPIVVKSRAEGRSVKYVNSKKELSETNIDNSVIQEYIKGDGYGYYALCDNGKILQEFMHHRLREYPITGGVSTCAESIFNEKLMLTGRKIVGGLKWNGVIMAEFKRDCMGDFYLIEINPKFWGSLDLAIVSGVDFPKLLVEYATIGVYTNDVKCDYKAGIKFRWAFPDDIMHLLANPWCFAQFVKDTFDKNIHGNIWLSDFKPTIIQICMTVGYILKQLFGDGIRYPHGKVK